MTKRQVLSIFSLMMITVTSVDNIRNLPSTALFGSQIIVFFFLGTLFFLLPTALISAELAANDEHQSGVYGWVKSVFRSQTGFIAVWLQWISNAVYYPGLMAYIAGTFAYLISPTLANNTTYLMIFVVIVFWAITILNLYGLRSSAWFTNLCGIFGLFLPVCLIFIMGTFWKSQPYSLYRAYRFTYL
jgi:amino acid transporter